MIKQLLFLITILITFISFSQNNWREFTGKQKAFFYQLTRKIEIFKPEIHHLFEFTDSIPYINDTLPDYPYIETAIEADSTKLICHHTEFTRKNRGILHDIGMHYASWELDLILHFRNSEKSKYAYLKPKFNEFVKLVLENSPSNLAKVTSSGLYELSPSVKNYFSPNLSITEKIAALKNSGFSDDDKFSIIKSIYSAQEKYLNKRANEIVKIISGETIQSTNYMLAAGNGDGWNELESVIRTKYNRPLPDPKALFNYQLKPFRDDKSGRKKIGIQSYPIIKMQTKANQSTHLHIDTWAYHPERQTTIIIQKGGNSYVLYGKNEHRLVSPDSTFEKGTTYWSLIQNLENVWIADLKERIYGKKGYDYLIELYEKKIVKTRKKIKTIEADLNHIRHTPEGPPKIKRKKNKKKNKGYSATDSKYVPRGKLSGNAKKRQVEQNKLVAQNGQLSTQLSTLKAIKKEKEEAFDVLAKYETKLERMKKNMGYSLMTYKLDKSGNYIFSDGAVFNYNTQDLIFNPTIEDNYFEVILVSFGEKVMTKNKDEIFIHFNLSYTKPKDVFTLYESRNTLKKIKAYSAADSIQITEFFNLLATTKLPLDLQLKSLGIANGEIPYFNSNTIKPLGFDKNTPNQLLHSILIQKQNTISIQIETHSNQYLPEHISKQVTDLKIKNPSLNILDIECALASRKYLEELKMEFSTLASLWIKDEKMKKIVLKKIKRLKSKTVLIKGLKIKL